MFFNFLDELRAAGIPASMKEHLILLEALDKDVIERNPEEFYYLSRSIFVKDEGLLDRFDQVFGKVFKGILTSYGDQKAEIPADWLKAIAEKFLTPEEMEADAAELAKLLPPPAVKTPGIAATQPGQNATGDAPKPQSRGRIDPFDPAFVAAHGGGIISKE